MAYNDPMFQLGMEYTMAKKITNEQRESFRKNMSKAIDLLQNRYSKDFVIGYLSQAYFSVATSSDCDRFDIENQLMLDIIKAYANGNG